MGGCWVKSDSDNINSSNCKSSPKRLYSETINVEDFVIK